MIAGGVFLSPDGLLFYIKTGIPVCLPYFPFHKTLLIDGNPRKHIDGLVQERRKSSALAIGLRLPCTYPIDVYT